MNIKIENFTKEIKGVRILEDITVEFESGKIYGLVGKNGSGKTMLLRAVSGLIRPTKGSVIVDGKYLHKDISFPQDMGIIIEKPDLLNYLTGFENLSLLAKINNKISKYEIENWMKKFSLDPKSKQVLKKYSLGMKQKIGIIQAIMEDQQFLVLDEPFNALDQDTVEMLRVLLKKYKDDGKLIIITSHHSEDIDVLCDEIIFIEEGKLII